MLAALITALLAPIGNAIALGIHALFANHKPRPILYSREIRTRRWIARLEGYRAVGDTRAMAAQRVLWLADNGALPNDF